MAAKNKNGLTKQQQSFADYHRSHPDIPEYKVYQKYYNPKSVASAKAGASRLLTNVNLTAYLISKQEITEKKVDYEQEEWVQDLVRLKRMCMAEEDINLVIEKLDENDEVQRFELKQRDFNPAGANKALETLGKFKKWLLDKPGVVVNNNTQNNHPMVFIAAEMDD